MTTGARAAKPDTQPPLFPFLPWVDRLHSLLPPAGSTAHLLTDDALSGAYDDAQRLCHYLQDEMVARTQQPTTPPGWNNWKAKV